MDLRANRSRGVRSFLLPEVSRTRAAHLAVGGAIGQGPFTNFEEPIASSLSVQHHAFNFRSYAYGCSRRRQNDDSAQRSPADEPRRWHSADDDPEPGT